MRNLLKFSIRWIFILAIFFYSCEKRDDSYKKYVVPSGLTYPGKAVSPKAFSGRDRIQISWPRGTDPSVIKARIFWNNYLDSVEVSIPKNGDTIKTIIDNLPEQQYTFAIVTYDAKGNRSIPVEVLGAAYGDNYQAGLLNRPINLSTINDEGTVNIQWGAANITGGAYASQISYVNSAGDSTMQVVPAQQTETTIADIKQGTALKFRTIYLPDSLSIDTFYTSYETYEDYTLDKSTWQVIAYSTEHDNGPDNRVENIIDGNPGTRWHTHLNDSHYPHFVVIDMQKTRTISSFEIFRMKDDDRGCDRFELSVSDDNVNWKVLGDFDFNRFSNEGQIYPFSTHLKARYFKFTGIAGPYNYMVMGEISVHGL